MTLKEINERMIELRSLIDTDDADLDAIEKEIKELNETRSTLEEKIEKREALLKEAMLTNEVVEEPQPEPRKEERKMDEKLTAENVLESPVYRSAWLKTQMGRELNEEEKRSIAVANIAGAVPTSTQADIVKKMREIAPLMNEIKMLFVPGKVTLAVEGTNNAAALHTENALIDAAADTLVSVSLDGFELAKLVRISESAATMSIPAYEQFLVEILAENIAVLIEEYIIYGTGDSQPKGINYAATWTDGTNGVDWASTKPTYAEIVELAGYLKGGYYRNAKWLMNHKTFFNDVQAIRDDSKLPLVREGANGEYFILGKPVVFSDYVKDGEMFLGDLKRVVGNLQKMEVRKSLESGFAYGAIDYRGLAIFDCDISVAEAFVKGEATLGV